MEATFGNAIRGFLAGNCRTTAPHVEPEVTKGRFKIFSSGIAGVQAVESDTPHVFPRRTHEQFGIGVIDRGAQRSHSGRGMVEAGSGDVISVNPSEVHDGAPIGDAGRAWRMLYFDPALIAEASRDLREGETGTYEFFHPVIRDAGLAGNFRKLFAILTRTDAGRMALQREELLLMLLPAMIAERKRVDDEPLVSQAILKAKTLLDDDPAARISLSDLARASGLSRFQVLRGFIRATAFTPHAYLVQRRIDMARRLIAGGIPLAQAALDSGFADQSHMTRIFVRKYGVSPRAYADAVT